MTALDWRPTTNRDLATCAVVVVALVAPAPQIGLLTVLRPDQLAVTLLLGMAIVSGRRLPPPRQFAALWLLTTLMAGSTLAAVVGRSAVIEIELLVGFVLGPVVAMSAGVLAYRNQLSARVLVDAIQLAAIPLGLLAIWQVLAPSAGALTVTMYGGDRALPVIEMMESFGRLTRATASFGSPSYAGTFFAIAAVTGARQTARGRRGWLPRLAIAASLMGGIATVSKTFLGLMLVALVVWGFSRSRKRQGTRSVPIALVGVVAVMAAGFFATVRQARGVGAELEYQLDQLSSSTATVSPRYGELGSTADALEAITDRPVLGHGVVEGLPFGGDSLAIALTMYFGCVGFVLFVLVIGRAVTALFAWSGPDSDAGVALLLALVAGVAASSLFQPRLAPVLWALAGCGLMRRRVEVLDGEAVRRARVRKKLEDRTSNTGP